MARGFSIMDMMNEVSREGISAEPDITEKVSVHNIQMNDGNFYEMSNMEQMKNSIFAMGGVQQPVLLVKTSSFRMPYRAVAGHRRIRACLELVKEGHREYEYIPAVIKNDIDAATEEMLLVMTNSTQRDLTDWEKVMQHMKLKEIIPRLKKRQGLDGRARAMEADYLGVSEGQIAIYNTVGTRLAAGLMEMFKNGVFGISLAYEAAKLEPKLQERLVGIARDNGGISEDDIRRLAGSSPMPGQMEISAYEPKQDTDAVTERVENVTESVTFGGKLDEERKKREEKAGGSRGGGFRGGYEPVLVDDLIRRYSATLGMIEREGRGKHKISLEYSCILDALDLLKEKMRRDRYGQE